MATKIVGELGGISGLREFLTEHKGAIEYDLNRNHWHLWDLGRTYGWGEFKSFIEWSPPVGESALWRSRKPRSWWVTPEIQFLASSRHVLELANWQRGGGKKAGPAPKPPKLPEDKQSVKPGTVTEKRKAQAEHLKRRRAQEER